MACARRHTPWWLLLLLLLAPAGAAMAQGVGTIVDVDGTAELGRGGTWTPIAIGSTVDIGDTLRTAQPGRLRVVFTDGTVIAVGDASEAQISAPLFDPRQRGTHALLRLNSGRMRALVSPRYRERDAVFEIETATAIARVRGTEFVITYDPVAEVTDVVGVTGQVAVHSVLDRVGRGVIITPQHITHVSRGRFPTPPLPLDQTIFRQYLDGLEFIGDGRPESIAIGDLWLLGQFVPEPDRATALAPPLRTAESTLPGPGTLNQRPSVPPPFIDWDDFFLPSSPIDQPPDVVESTDGGVEVEF